MFMKYMDTYYADAVFESIKGYPEVRLLCNDIVMRPSPVACSRSISVNWFEF